MAEWISNCPVSWPVKIPDLTPEVDLGGVMFSYQYGLVYNPPGTVTPLRQPYPQG